MRRIILLIGAIVLIVAGVMFSFSGASFAVNNKIIPGVYAGSLNLGGLTREQAREQLASMEEKLANTPVVLKHADNTWTMEAGSLGIALDVEKTLQKAVALGHTGSIINQWREQRQVKHEGRHIEPEMSVDRGVLEKKTVAEAGDIIVEPVNAGFRITPADQVEIVPAQSGTSIDFDALEREVSELMKDAAGKEGDSNDDEVGVVELPLLTIQPQRTTEDIEAMQINGRIARYATQFDAGQAGRTYNIKVAAAALDGVLLAPGEDFSFNRVVGPRSSEAGYKNANVIVNNELVQGLGGGVCQVSSTLYNAVLLADLKIAERNNHTLPVAYVPMGQDATVVYGAIDFRFVNNQENYIYISSLVEGNTLIIKIYGNVETAPRVEVASWVTETIKQQIIYEKDPNLATGEQVVKQKGNNGFKVNTVRYVWKNGEKVTEQLPVSYYHPVNRIVAVGTGQVKPSVVVPPDSAVTPVNPGETDEPSPPVSDNGDSGEGVDPAPSVSDDGNSDDLGEPPVNSNDQDIECDDSPPETETVPDPATVAIPGRVSDPVPSSWYRVLKVES
ncbi:VanW family protein [Desulfoscipio gibsoniae]|uniref:Putative vancomycin resistance protein n=1 Tax=Desulfoscipio gibsoniae DSM 7213 TaxID=767817 RepID=R4KHK1_9FIRM|nr:VanW family protein [Desulfoscipio gibsoniae]AGL02079.1 putative vancomycin resistance protein [Desulfoscipio gibsoniae DSM 7213]